MTNPINDVNKIKFSVVGALLVSLLLCLSSCSSDISSPDASSSDLAVGTVTQGGISFTTMPPPSILAKNVSDDNTVHRIGADYDPLFPTQHVSVVASALLFDPLWQPPAHSDNANLAFVMYSMDLTGFNGESTLQMTWDGVVPSTDNIWLGFSDWERDSWVWSNPQSPTSRFLDPSTLDQYSRDSDDALNIVVLITGMQQARLVEIYFGTSVSSDAHAYAMPDDGWSPLDVTLSAFGSDEAGAVTAYEWDLDGDGTYETDATSTGGYTSRTCSAGSHTMSLKVTYQGGSVAYDSVAIDVRDPAASSVDYDAVFDDSVVRRVNISVSQANWDAMWVNPMAELEVEADALVFPGTSLEADLPSIGLRMKGNSSLHGPGEKKPWKIDTNEYVDGQEFANLKMLIFNNGFKDPSLTREMLGYDMMYQAGIPSSSTSYVEIWFTIGSAPEEFWGVYTMVERVDKKFLENRYGDDTGNLYKASMGSSLEYLGDNIYLYPQPDGEPCYSKETNSSENDYSDLFNFLRVLNDNYASEDEFTTALEGVFDVDIFLRYIAVTLGHSNLDVYMYMTQNYYLYNNPTTGRFTWIPWDLNEAWGVFGDGNANQNHPLYELTSIGGPGGGANTPLFDKVMEVEQYRRDLAAYYDLLRHTVFTESGIATQAEAYHDLIRDAVYQGDKNFVGGGAPYTLEMFDANWQSDVYVPGGPGGGWLSFGVASFTVTRVSYIDNHLMEYTN